MGCWPRSVLLCCMILAHSLTADMASGVADDTEREQWHGRKRVLCASPVFSADFPQPQIHKGCPLCPKQGFVLLLLAILSVFLYFILKQLILWIDCCAKRWQGGEVGVIILSYGLLFWIKNANQKVPCFCLNKTVFWHAFLYLQADSLIWGVNKDHRFQDVAFIVKNSLSCKKKKAIQCSTWNKALE